MDYSSDNCQDEFTAGQKVRVIAAMTSLRSSFLASNGNMSLVPPVAPITAFNSSSNFVCSGDVEDYGVYIMTACVTPSISVTGTSDPTSCISSNGSIIINGTGSGDVVWTGPTSGSAIGASLPYTITGLTNGTYSIQYGISGCQSSVVTATLNAPGQLATPIITAGGSTTFCDGGSVTLTSSYPTGNVWSTGETATLNIAGNLNDATQWEVYTGSCGGTSIGNTTGTSFVVTPTAPGTTYFIRGEGGCTTPSSCAAITINVNANTAGSEAVTACDSYTWLTNGTTYNASGVFTNVLVNSNGCDSIVTLNLTINPSPVVLLNPFGTICDTDSDFSLMGGSPSGGTYSGTGVSGGVFSPTSAGIGTFSIMYTYTETNGCTDSIAQDIFVVDCSSLGELENESIILYPNPSFDFVNIISENEKIDRIRVYDGAGRLIQDDLIDSDIQTLDISDYSTGVYQIQIELGGNVYWKRLVKN